MLTGSLADSQGCRDLRGGVGLCKLQAEQDDWLNLLVP